MRRCPTCRRPFVDEETSCPLDGGELVPADGPAPADLGRALQSYRLVGLCGEGGMGRVFVARHVQLKRLVALKWLRPELAERRAEVARFFDEARVANQIRNPHIVEVIDFVEDVFAGAYFVMELLRGHDLRRELTAGVVPLDRAVHVAAQVAEAISAAHAVGVLHRDLKPENVVLIERAGRDDYVKLVDFGVARIGAVEEGQDGGRGSRRAAPAGTPAYMSPEQAAGGPLDGRSDVYSLGVILYEMVSGRHPFPSRTDAEYLIRHAGDPPPRPTLPSGKPLPPALEEAILRCLAKEPEGRYESGAALAVALRAVDLAAAPATRSGARWAALGGLAVAAVAAGLFAVRAGDTGRGIARPPPRAAPPAARSAPPRESVTLAFRSEPPGAEVRRVGETVLLGLTPFEERFLRGDGTIRVRFRRAGHDEVELEVPLGESRQVSATLPVTAAPPASPATAPTVAPAPVPPETPTKRPKPRGRKPGGRDGVVDPFSLGGG